MFGLTVDMLARGAISQSGYDVVPELLDTGATAILSSNDLAALGALARSAA